MRRLLSRLKGLWCIVERNADGTQKFDGIGFSADA
jgi:hypothetical protein